MALLIKRTLESSSPKDLCLILRKKFSIKLAIDIQQYLQIDPIEPNKIGIGFIKDLKLTYDQKETLRECLRFIYGEKVVIVASSAKIEITEKVIVPFTKLAALSLDKAKAQEAETKEEKETKSIAHLTQWQKVREHLASIYGDDLVRVSFIKLDISESKNEITFMGSDTFTEMVEGKFGASLNWLAKEYGLHFVFKGKSKAFEELVVSEIRGSSHGQSN